VPQVPDLVVSLIADIDSAKQLIVERAKELYSRGLFSTSGGNISARVGDTIVMTPRRASEGGWRIDVQDLTTCDLEGNIIQKGRGPSIDLDLHLVAYNTLPAKGAIHSHHPLPSAFAFAGVPLVTQEGGEWRGLDRIPLIPYAPPGSTELTAHLIEGFQQLRETFQKHRYGIVLMKKHGAFIVGENVDAAIRAYDRLVETSLLVILQKTIQL